METAIHITMLVATGIGLFVLATFAVIVLLLIWAACMELGERQYRRRNEAAVARMIALKPVPRQVSTKDSDQFIKGVEAYANELG